MAHENIIPINCIDKMYIEWWAGLRGNEKDQHWEY